MTRDQRDDVYLSLLHHCGNRRADTLQRALDKHRPLRDGQPLPPEIERKRAIRAALDTLGTIEDSTPVRIYGAAEALTEHREHLTDPQRQRLGSLLRRVEKVAPHVAERLYEPAGKQLRNAPTASDREKAQAIRQSLDTLMNLQAPAAAVAEARATVAELADSLSAKQLALFAKIESRLESAPVREAFNTLAAFKDSNPERIAKAGQMLVEHRDKLTENQLRFLAVVLRRLDPAAPFVADQLYDLVPEAKRARDIRRAIDTLASKTKPTPALGRAAIETLATHRDTLTDKQRGFLGVLARRMESSSPELADGLYELLPEAKRARDIRRAIATLEAAGAGTPEQLHVALDTLATHGDALTDHQRRTLTWLPYRIESVAPFAADGICQLVPEAQRARAIRQAFDTLKTARTAAPDDLRVAVDALTTHTAALTPKQRKFAGDLLPRVQQVAPELASQLKQVTKEPPPKVEPDEPPRMVEVPAPEAAPEPQASTSLEPEPTVDVAVELPQPEPTQAPEPEPFTPSAPVFHFPDKRPHPLIQEQLTLLQSDDVGRSLDAATFLHTHCHDLGPAEHRAIAEHVATWSAPDSVPPEDATLDRERVALTRQIMAQAPKELAATQRLEVALAVRDITQADTPPHNVKRAIATLNRHHKQVTDYHRQLLHRAPLHQQDRRNEQALYKFLARYQPKVATPRKPRTAAEHLDIAITTLGRYPNTSPERTRHALTALTTLSHKLTDAQKHVVRTRIPKLRSKYPHVARRLTAVTQSPTKTKIR